MRRATPRPLLTGLLAVSLLASSPALAQGQAGADEATMSVEEKREAAFASYQAGVQAFREGDYQAAASRFERAARLDPNPIVYFNLSLAYSKLARPADALQAAERAEASGELPPDTQTKNRARIRGFRSAISARSAADAVVAERERQKTVVAKQNRSFTERLRDPGEMEIVGWAGVGTAGLGVVLLSYSLILDGSIGDDIEAYDAAVAAGEIDSAQRLHTQIEDTQSSASALLWSGIGLMAIGGGLVAYDLYWYGEKPGAELSATIGPDGAAVEASWSF